MVAVSYTTLGTRKRFLWIVVVGFVILLIASFMARDGDVAVSIFEGLDLGTAGLQAKYGLSYGYAWFIAVLLTAVTNPWSFYLIFTLLAASGVATWLTITVSGTSPKTPPPTPASSAEPIEITWEFN